MPAKLTHLLCLVRGDRQIGAGLSCAKQDKARLPIFGIIGERIALVDASTMFEYPGTG
jgi:hypothetical protein